MHEGCSVQNIAALTLARGLGNLLLAQRSGAYSPRLAEVAARDPATPPASVRNGYSTTKSTGEEGGLGRRLFALLQLGHDLCKHLPALHCLRVIGSQAGSVDR